MPDGKDYVGEYFMAVLTGSESSGYSYHIMQISPVVYLAKTDKRQLAVELVNRLDVTGDEPVDTNTQAEEIKTAFATWEPEELLNLQLPTTEDEV